jgi:hypothetical protein
MGQVWPNFKLRIVDVYNPDIFIHSWTDEAWHGPGKNRLGFIANTPLIDQTLVKSTYNPTLAVFDNYYDGFDKKFEELGKAYTNFNHIPKNTISMFYKTAKGIQLLEEHMMNTNTQYDLVIRMRPDLIFHDALPAWDANKFYTIAMRNNLGRGTGADMQIGNTHMMMNFSKLSCNLPLIYNHTKLLCAHMLTEAWIQMLNLPWYEFYVPKTLQHTPLGEYQDVRHLAGSQDV